VLPVCGSALPGGRAPSEWKPALHRVFLTQLPVKPGDFGAHFFEDLGLVDADAGFGDAELLGDLFVGNFPGNHLEDLLLGFVDVVFDVIPGEVGDVQHPFLAGEVFDVGQHLLLDGEIVLLIFHGVASGDEVFLGAEEVPDGVAGHGGEPVVEFPLVLVVLEILDLLPDLGEHGLADVFCVLLVDAHADDQTQDEPAVDFLKLKPCFVVVGLLQLGQQRDPRRIVV